MKFFVTALLILVAVGYSVPAEAYIEQVFLPENVDTGQATNLQIFGSMPDGCWVLQGFTASVEGLVARVVINTFYDNPDGAGCPLMLVPYEVFPELVFNEPGLYTVQIIEYAVHPLYGTNEYSWEGTILVTGETPVQPVVWSSLKALYR